MAGSRYPYRIMRDERLAYRTTFGIGGTVPRLVEVAPTVEGLAAVWEEFGGDGITVLGGGSNLLVADEGYPGTVVMLSASPPLQFDAGGTVVVGASEPWDDLVTACAEAGLSGIERTAGIPGTVGGALVQNAGAYGQFVEDVLQSVRCFDPRTGSVVVLPKERCELAYRSSIFRRRPHDYVILDATIALTPATSVAVGLEKLTAIVVHVLRQPEGPTFALERVAEAVRVLRFSRQSIAAFQCRSAGSFFLNYELPADDPIRSKVEEIFLQQVADLKAAGETFMSDWDIYKPNPGYLFAGSLIGTAVRPEDAAAFRPGSQHGRLRLSIASSNTIINRGNASASEVVDLAKRLRDNVEDMYGITLRPEVRLVGPPGFETF